jgi:hypothetical protein
MSLDNNTPSRVREYRHPFNGHRRITATIRISLARAGLLHTGDFAITRCEWGGSKEKQPSAELYPEFRIWMDGVLTDVVEQTGKRLLFVFEPPGKPRVAELWLYDPGKAPRLARTLRNPFGKPLPEALFGARGWEEDTPK